MQLPIINGIYSTGETDFGVAYPVNMVAVPVESGISKGYLRPGDGIVPFCALPGLDRGGINWNGAHYRVAGSKFVRVDPNGSVAVLGEVGYGGRASFDYSFERLGIAASGKLFYYDGAAFVEVTDVDLGTVVDMLWVDGYFMTTDGEFLVTTELTDPTAVSPFKYGSSEIDPDPIVAIKKINNNIYAVNRYSIEAFGNTGGEFFPFSRIEGAQAERGAVGTHAVAVANGMLVFIGSGRNESFGLYASTNGETQKLSTREIDRILNSYTEEVLSDVLVEFFLYDGHENIMIHLPDKTLSLDMKATAIVEEPAWSVLSSGKEKVSRYRCINHVYAFNNWFVADPLLPRLGVLSKKVSTHWGEEVAWEFYTSIVYNEAKGAIFHELELITVPGDGTGTLGVSGLASTPGIKAVPPSSEIEQLTPTPIPDDTYVAAKAPSFGIDPQPLYAADIDTNTLAGTPNPGFSDLTNLEADNMLFSNNNKALAMATEFDGANQAELPGLLIYRESGGAYSRTSSDYFDMLRPEVSGAPGRQDLIVSATGQRVSVSASGDQVVAVVRLDQLKPAIAAAINPVYTESVWSVSVYQSTQEILAAFEYNPGTDNYDLIGFYMPPFNTPEPTPGIDEFHPPFWAFTPGLCPFVSVAGVAALTASDGFTAWFHNNGQLWDQNPPRAVYRGVLGKFGTHATQFNSISDPLADPWGPEGRNTGHAYLGAFSVEPKWLKYANGDQYRALLNPIDGAAPVIQYRQLVETELSADEVWADAAALDAEAALGPLAVNQPLTVAFSPDNVKLVVGGTFDEPGRLMFYNFTPDPRPYKTGAFQGGIAYDETIDHPVEASSSYRLLGFTPSSNLMFASGFGTDLALKKNAGTGKYQPVLDGFGVPYYGGIETFDGALGGFAFKELPVPLFGGGGSGSDPGWPTTPGYDGVPSLILNGDASYKATQGVGGTVWASYSTDGRTWSQERPAKTGRLGDNKARLRWFKNGMMRHWRIQKFRGTSSAFVSIAALEARIEPLGH